MYFFRENRVENCIEIAKKGSGSYKISMQRMMEITHTFKKQISYQELFTIAYQDSQVVEFEEIKEEMKCLK